MVEETIYFDIHPKDYTFKKKLGSEELECVVEVTGSAWDDLEFDIVELSNTNVLINLSLFTNKELNVIIDKNIGQIENELSGRGTESDIRSMTGTEI